MYSLPTTQTTVAGGACEPAVILDQRGRLHVDCGAGCAARVFLLLEASLRWLNIGQDFGYFRHIEIEGEPFLQENPVFAHQFYAPELNIGPLYNTLAANLDADNLRVYLLGGSAAMGFPHRNHGLDRLLATRLKVALPNKQIEVINTAMTAVNSHVIYEVAKAMPNRRVSSP